MAVFFFFFFPIKFKQFVCHLLTKIYGFCSYHCLLQDFSFNFRYKHIYKFHILANDSMSEKWSACLIFDKIISILSTSVRNTENFFLVWALRVKL